MKLPTRLQLYFNCVLIFKVIPKQLWSGKTFLYSSNILYDLDRKPPANHSTRWWKSLNNISQAIRFRVHNDAFLRLFYGRRLAAVSRVLIPLMFRPDQMWLLCLVVFPRVHPASSYILHFSAFGIFEFSKFISPLRMVQHFCSLHQNFSLKLNWE